jgi:hypothetical protein
MPSSSEGLELAYHPTTLTPEEWKEVMPWIREYYATGTLHIPAHVRGYDVLAAVEFFGILHSTDQCHFANYEAYKRVQLWSRYLCHREALAEFVTSAFPTTPTASTVRQWGTAREGDVLELGTKPLFLLGDFGNHHHQSSTTAGAADEKHMCLGRLAYKIFNATHETNPRHRNNHHDDSAISEEMTAREMRDDFASYLQNLLPAATVTFTVKPVTVLNELALSAAAKTSSDEATEKSSSSQQHYQIVNRAVLTVDFGSTHLVLNDKEVRQLLDRKVRSKSELEAPVDELVEEEMNKGRLEELVQQVDQRTKQAVKSNLKVTFKASPASVIGGADVGDPIIQSSSSSQQGRSEDLAPKSLLYDDDDDALNAPEDELHAPVIHKSKKKKKKPVFEWPETFLQTDPHAMVKSPPPSGWNRPTTTTTTTVPITLIRTTSHELTVTSALTGPFYIDENGNLRDVFEQNGSDSDEEDNETRALRQRHEWIQATLLNQGIDQRVEELLNQKESDMAKNSNHVYDPWDWLYGLGVCEFSRNFMEHVEKCAKNGFARYTAPEGVHPFATVPISSQPDPKVATTERPVSPTPSQNTMLAPPTVCSDALPPITAAAAAAVPNIPMIPTVSEQSRQDLSNDEHDDSRDDSKVSDESPRGVTVLRSDVASAAAKKKAVAPSTTTTATAGRPMEVAATGQSATLPESPARKKSPRGLKNLFRRRNHGDV